MQTIWSKLKKVKFRFKGLHKNDFPSIEKIIVQARDDLQHVQVQLQSKPVCATLHQAEKECIMVSNKFVHIEVSALRQKSMIQWLKLRNSNTQFIFHATKERYMQNNIEVLFTEAGELIQTQDI